MTKRSHDGAIATIGIDIGKNTFHLIGLDAKGAIVVRQKLSRGQVGVRLANVPPCLIGMEACVGAHHLSRQLLALGHDARLMPARYVKPFLKGQKNDFRDAEAIAEAVQRPTMRFVPTKSVEQLDLQALHRVRARLVRHRTAVINQIRALLLERGIAVRQGYQHLRAALPDILGRESERLSPRMVHMIAELSSDWRQLDERLEAVTDEIETLARADEACQRLMSVPGIGPIIASAMVSAIGDGAAFAKGRDFAAWLGLVPRQISTGDRTILGRISKRGNSYLRTLFVRRPRRAGHSVEARELAQAQLRAVAPSRFTAPAPQCPCRRARQQAGAHRLERARRRAPLPIQAACRLTQEGTINDQQLEDPTEVCETD